MARFGQHKDEDDDDSKPRGKRNLPILVAPQIVEPRCKCCVSPFRNTIDRLLVMGVSYATIAQEFETEQINRKNLSNHHKRHLSIEHRAIREILEEEAKRTIENVDEAKTTILTGRAWMTTALNKTFTMLLDGTLKIEGRDVVQMINLMEKMQNESATIEKEELLREYNLFATAVKKIVPSEMWNLIVYELERMAAQEKSLIQGTVMPDVTHELPSAQFPGLDVTEET